MKQSKFLSLKEFVIVLLLACVETAIGLVVTMPFAANLQLVYFLAPGLAGLINGIIYVLIIKKCPKIGTQFIIPAIYGLYFLFSGSVYVFTPDRNRRSFPFMVGKLLLFTSLQPLPGGHCLGNPEYPVRRVEHGLTDGGNRGEGRL